MKGSVSVVIPCFNSAAWIGATIRSCIAQGPLLREIIVVDDASSDNSIAVIRELQQEFPQVRLVKSPAKGANAARNYGFQLSSGSYVQWLDADDLLLEGKFEAQVQLLEAYPDVDIVYSDIEMRYYEKDRVVETSTRAGAPDEDYLKELLLDHWTGNNSYLLRRSAADLGATLNGWNPTTWVHQDTEYFTLLAIHGLKFKYLPGVFATYSKWSTESISRLHYRKKALHRFRLFEQFRSEINQMQHFSKTEIDQYESIINTFLLQLTIYAPGVRWSQSFPYLTVQPSLIQTRARYALFPAYLWLWIKGLFR